MQIGPAKAPPMQGGITAGEVGSCFTTCGPACADDAFPLSFTPWARVWLSHGGNRNNGAAGLGGSMVEREAGRGRKWRLTGVTHRRAGANHRFRYPVSNGVQKSSACRFSP